jgi:hypothetical protein
VILLMPSPLAGNFTSLFSHWTRIGITRSRSMPALYVRQCRRRHQCISEVSIEKRLPTGDTCYVTPECPAHLVIEPKTRQPFWLETLWNDWLPLQALLEGVHLASHLLL